MAKLKATSRFSSKGYNGPQLYGVQEVISKLESIGASSEAFAKQAMEETLLLYEKAFREWWLKNGHNRPHSGLHTLDALGSTIEVKDKRTRGEVGFFPYGPENEKGKGAFGLPALFLDIGTKTQDPTYFIFYVSRETAKKAKDLQAQLFHDFIEKCMAGKEVTS